MKGSEGLIGFLSGWDLLRTSQATRDNSQEIAEVELKRIAVYSNYFFEMNVL
jgi:hypothetical protein